MTNTKSIIVKGLSNHNTIRIRNENGLWYIDEFTNNKEDTYYTWSEAPFSTEIKALIYLANSAKQTS